MTYLCDHGGDNHVPAEYYILRKKTKRWKNGTVVLAENNVWDEAYACCAIHLSLALDTLLANALETDVFRIRKV